eukprot:SAG31_NODE_8429_length_1454_cov_1.263469_1_plen_166_part_00
MPLVGAFLCSHILRKMQGQIGAFGSLPFLKTWDRKPLDMLFFLEQNAVGAETLSGLFDEFVCGSESTYEQKQALKLFGIHSPATVTRLDLAVLSDNKLFLGHPLTTSFLYQVWAERGTGGWVQATPRTKYFGQLVGHICFLGLFIVSFLEMPMHGPGKLFAIAHK